MRGSGNATHSDHAPKAIISGRSACSAAAGRAYLPSCTAFFATRMPEGAEGYLLYMALPAVSLTWIAGAPLRVWGLRVKGRRI